MNSTSAQALDQPAGPLLIDQLRFMAYNHGNEIAYENISTGASITFANWDTRANQIANWLVGLGIAIGDRVALYLESAHCLEWICAYSAIHKAGGVMVPVNTRLSTEEIITILRHAEPKAILTGGDLVNDYTRFCEQIAEHSAVALTPAPTSTSALHLYNSDVIDRASTDDPNVPLTLDDLADIMYTSGTTGLPKGVLVRHGNVAMIPNCTPHWSGAGWLHGAPLFTFAGMSFIYNPMKMGLRGMYLPKFEAPKWCATVAEREPIMAFLVPAMAELLASSVEFEATDTSSLLAVSIGSAPLAPATLAKLQTKISQASVTNSYGLTEAGPAFIVMPKGEAENRIGSVGKPMPPMQVRIVAEDADQDCEAFAVGELLVRLPGARREYYKDPEATQAAWTSDGWLRTGDLAYLDNDGFVYINGRIKDMIIRGGHNIYATDVEAVILERPEIREVAVIGLPHRVLGEDVAAIVVFNEGAHLAPEALLAHCTDRLADYKRPRVLHFVDDLPRNATGKVMKHILRETFTK